MAGSWWKFFLLQDVASKRNGCSSQLLLITSLVLSILYTGKFTGSPVALRIYSSAAKVAAVRRRDDAVTVGS